jgi:hypothetical protein
VRLGVRSMGLVSLAVAAALLAGCGTGPATARAPGSRATLTGYARTSPMDEAGVATSRRLTPARTAALRRAIESLRVVPRAECMENQLLFTLALPAPQGHGPTWTATALLCPVPGQIEVGATTYRATCSVIRLAASYVPAGTSGACFATRH